MKVTTKIIYIIFLCFSFILLFYRIQDIVNAKDLYPSGSTVTVNGFYSEKENDIDVLALGTSNSFCSFNPLIMYEEYGIASYCFSTPAQPLRITRLYLEEALKTQKPQVVCLEVLDCSSSSLEYREQGLRWGLTPLRNSKEKMECIYDILGGGQGFIVLYMAFVSL